MNAYFGTPISTFGNCVTTGYLIMYPGEINPMLRLFRWRLRPAPPRRILGRAERQVQRRKPALATIGPYPRAGNAVAGDLVHHRPAAGRHPRHKAAGFQVSVGLGPAHGHRIQLEVMGDPERDALPGQPGRAAWDGIHKCFAGIDQDIYLRRRELAQPVITILHRLQGRIGPIRVTFPVDHQRADLLAIQVLADQLGKEIRLSSS